MNTPAAIIPVAGLSSRMGRFKPLLELNGFPMIRLTAQSVLDGGVRQLCVVTGLNASEVEAAFPEKEPRKPRESVVRGLDAHPDPQKEHIIFVHNPRFAESDMLQSIKLGLASLLETGEAPSAVFILPGDIPAISPRTFVALQKHRELADTAVLVPTYQHKRGHPLLIGSACFDALLAFTGDGGLRQALSGFEWEELEVDDPGILLDSDDPQAFERLELYARKTCGVNAQVVDELFARYGTPENVRAHCLAVAQVAHRIAHTLNTLPYGIDTELCRSGGALHDLNRLEHKHSQVAAAHLRHLGYDALAAVVAAHDRTLTLEPDMFTEANIVFVADKLVKETTLVNLEDRYEGATKRFPPTTEIGARIQKDRISASALLERYIHLTGDEAILQPMKPTRREDNANT